MSFFLTTTRSDAVLDSNTSGDTNADDQKQIPDFLTMQSLSFPVASGAIAAVWKILQETFPDHERLGGRYVPLLLASLLMLGVWASQWKKLDGFGARFGAAIIAGFNAVLLTAAALGLQDAFTKAFGSGS
jgi:hypothetical protein